jgi:hypothetical protein
MEANFPAGQNGFFKRFPITNLQKITLLQQLFAHCQADAIASADYYSFLFHTNSKKFGPADAIIIIYAV